MSLLSDWRSTGTGKHRTVSNTEKDAEIARLTAALAESERANHAMAHDLTQAALTITTQRRRLHNADQLLKSWAGKVVRAEAEHRRLRQAVINARPRITFAPPPLVPPYAALSLPYPVPVQGPDPSAETTQKIPILADLASVR